MLTNKQKRFLRSEANQLQPLIQIGKNGLTEAVVELVEEALEAKELIKLSILQNCAEDKNDIAKKLEKLQDLHIVQIIGSTIIVYRESLEKKRIELPE